MPPEVDQDLAQLYAAMIAQQTTPTYDDGASLLQRNPAMMDVGLFGKPKPKPVAPPVDIQRRKLFGLSETPSAPVPAPMPMQPPALSPVYKALTAPMSRRDFLRHTARAAGNMALRGALPELGALAETQAPLTEAAKAVGETIADPHAAIWGTLREALQDHVADYGVDYARDVLHDAITEGVVPKEIVKKFDKKDKQFAALDEAGDEEGKYALHEEMQELFGNFIDKLDSSHVLTTLEDVGFDIDASDIAEMLHSRGFKPEQIHDFLDENHPGYDQEAVNEVLRDMAQSNADPFSELFSSAELLSEGNFMPKQIALLRNEQLLQRLTPEDLQIAQKLVPIAQQKYATVLNKNPAEAQFVFDNIRLMGSPAFGDASPQAVEYALRAAAGLIP